MSFHWARCHLFHFNVRRCKWHKCLVCFVQTFLFTILSLAREKSNTRKYFTARFLLGRGWSNRLIHPRSPSVIDITQAIPNSRELAINLLRLSIYSFSSWLSAFIPTLKKTRRLFVHMYIHLKNNIIYFPNFSTV